MLPDNTILGVFVSFSLLPFEFLVIVSDTDRVEVACYPGLINTHVRCVVVHISIRIEKINSSGLWLTNPVVCVRAAVVVN